MLNPLFFRRFRDFVLEHSLIKPGERLIVGCSGGPDSVALLRVLYDWNTADRLGLTVCIAHLNHRLRGQESEADEAFVRDLAARLNARCFIEAVDLPALRAQTDAGMEELARKERFSFFQRAAYDCVATKVLVGHHADDNAETILHRIVRGTGLRGLAGIGVRREMIEHSGIELIRPMLCFRRQEILDYLADIKQDYRIDSSNALPTHTRNRIRHQIIPQLETHVNPRTVPALLRLSEQASLAYDYLAETARRTFDALLIDGGPQSISLNRLALSKKSLPVQAEVVRLAIIESGVGEQDVTYEHIRQLLRQLAEDKPGQRKIDLPGGLRVVQEANHLVFLKRNAGTEPAIEPQPITVPGKIYFPTLKLRICLDIREFDYSELKSFKERKTQLEEWVDLETIEQPLILRSRQPDDRFWPLGQTSRKRLSDFLSSIQVQSWQRDRVPILADAAGPVWVVGYRIDQRVRLTRTTKQVLQLTVERLDE